MKKSLFNTGDQVVIKASDKTVTISNCQYVKNMKRYSYTVKEYPTTFFFEEELSELEEIRK
ncbi:hypothetical protein [Alkalihalobacterium alkalinitrilicum]|uniref:hypothetical protein n=1 Tax=Alkalihalobacterium alkalinitrilicum TaxID=427920 RepID=UPI00099534C4|nr:hypothetical protein [Alkalihalobacterium alkalinitrilicum]